MKRAGESLNDFEFAEREGSEKSESSRSGNQR